LAWPFAQEFAMLPPQQVLRNLYGFFKNSGNFAMFTAIRHASSRVSNLAAERVRHTIEAAEKYSQFCPFERGQSLRVSGDCEGLHVSALRSLRF